ncbi:hypothetical protein TRFO_02946 [Tritrichomonas foetus]|uniref:Importin N-terminal domain-containing protein n=1 Tax=Tritrichomonas foetus TaxID=1144522 RepID=A0A1J4KU92_9EUKA|nr:hypothetical protein TRFO_02946 [Tritrichomonas foetus]|eukprot:OHT14706.1 hypothetical protein TRFO_02946 [Tritrichomonas foetus]
MLSESQLQELERTIVSLYTTGQTRFQQDLYDTWFKNTNYFETAKSIVESSSNIPFSHFAIRSINSQLDYLYTTWSPQQFLEMSEWCLNVFMSQIERFISVPLLMQAFCAMFGHLVLLGWHISEEFQDFSFISFGSVSPSDQLTVNPTDLFWRQIEEQTLAQWCGKVRLYTAIVECMTGISNLKTPQMKKFMEKPLFQCFDFAIKTIERVVKGELHHGTTHDQKVFLAEYAIQLLIACLSFDDLQSDNIEKMKIVLPKTWIKYRNQNEQNPISNLILPSFPNIIHTIFQLYEIVPEKSQIEVLKLILLFASIHSDVKSRIIQDKIKFYEVFFDRITKNTLSKNDINDYVIENLPMQINIILKVMIHFSDLEDLISVSVFPNFVSSVFSITMKIFNIEFLATFPEAIINILKFWEYLSTALKTSIKKLEGFEDSTTPLQFRKMVQLDDVAKDIIEGMISQIAPMIDEVVSNYIQLLKRLIDHDKQLSYRILFDELSQSAPLMTLVLSIGKLNNQNLFQEMLNTLGGLLHQYKANPQNGAIQMNLCLYAMLIFPPIAKKQTNDPFFDPSMIGLISLLTVTKEINSSGNVNDGCLEEVILYLIEQFVKSPVLCIEKVLSPTVCEQSGFESNLDLHTLFATRISQTMRVFASNEKIMEHAMKTLQKWTEIPESNIQKNIQTIFTTEFLDVYDSVLEKFFDSPQTKHARIMFHQIVGKVLCIDNPDDPKFYPFFQKITNRYNLLLQTPDEKLALGLILDLRGIVHGIGLEAYIMVFKFIYPMLEIFHQASLRFLALVNPYLKFLSELTNDRNARIKFPPHSADGLRLAKISMMFVIAFCDNAPKSLEQSNKGLFYAMQIMEHILTGSFSNIGALVAYNDPILVQLFTSFLHFAHEVDFNEIVQYPRQLEQIVKLMCCLFQNFAEYIVKIDITFLRTALVICTYSNNTSYLPIENSFTVISEVTDFCVSILETPSGQELYENTKEAFNGVLLMLENMLMKMKPTMKYQESDAIFLQLVELTKNVLRMKPTIWPEVKHRLMLFLRNSKGRFINDLTSIE